MGSLSVTVRSMPSAKRSPLFTFPLQPRVQMSITLTFAGSRPKFSAYCFFTYDEKLFLWLGLMGKNSSIWKKCRLAMSGRLAVSSSPRPLSSSTVSRVPQVSRKCFTHLMKCSGVRPVGREITPPGLACTHSMNLAATTLPS